MHSASDEQATQETCEVAQSVTLSTDVAQTQPASINPPHRTASSPKMNGHPVDGRHAPHVPVPVSHAVPLAQQIGSPDPPAQSGTRQCWQMP